MFILRLNKKREYLERYVPLAQRFFTTRVSLRVVSGLKLIKNDSTNPGFFWHNLYCCLFSFTITFASSYNDFIELLVLEIHSHERNAISERSLGLTLTDSP